MSNQLIKTGLLLTVAAIGGCGDGVGDTPASSSCSLSSIAGCCGTAPPPFTASPPAAPDPST